VAGSCGAEGVGASAAQQAADNAHSAHSIRMGQGRNKGPRAAEQGPWPSPESSFGLGRGCMRIVVKRVRSLAGSSLAWVTRPLSLHLELYRPSLGGCQGRRPMEAL
jgi:hypothetical protein